MSNQIAKMFSQQFGVKVTLKSQQTGKKRKIKKLRKKNDRSKSR